MKFNNIILSLIFCCAVVQAQEIKSISGGRAGFDGSIVSVSIRSENDRDSVLFTISDDGIKGSFSKSFYLPKNSVFAHKENIYKLISIDYEDCSREKKEIEPEVSKEPRPEIHPFLMSRCRPTTYVKVEKIGALPPEFGKNTIVLPLSSENSPASINYFLAYPDRDNLRIFFISVSGDGIGELWWQDLGRNNKSTLIVDKSMPIHKVKFFVGDVIEFPYVGKLKIKGLMKEQPSRPAWLVMSPDID